MQEINIRNNDIINDADDGFEGHSGGFTRD